MSNRLNIYVGGVVVGFVEGDTFYKSINSQDHILHTPPAIAFAETSLDDAADVGAIWVQVFVKDKNKVYTASIKRIWEDGFAIERAGFEKQRALPLTKFIDGTVKAEQLAFWEGV